MDAFNLGFSSVKGKVSFLLVSVSWRSTYLHCSQDKLDRIVDIWAGMNMVVGFEIGFRKNGIRELWYQSSELGFQDRVPTTLRINTSGL